MSDHPWALITGALTLGAASVVAFFELIPGFNFVWQFGLIGGFIGTYIASRREVRDPDYPTLRLIWRWTALGLAFGLLAQLASAVL